MAARFMRRKNNLVFLATYRRKIIALLKAGLELCCFTRPIFVILERERDRDGGANGSISDNFVIVFNLCICASSEFFIWFMPSKLWGC
jgi:hypothetical protein